MRKQNRRTPKGKHFSLSALKGHRIGLPSHPVEFTSEPWFPLTVRVVDCPAVVDVSVIYTAFKTQLADIFATNAALAFRVQTLRLWGPIPATNAELILQVSDLIAVNAGSSTTIGTLAEISSFADQVNRATAGYEFPWAQQQVSLPALSLVPTTVARTRGAGTGSVLYVKLLWRPFRSASPTFVDRPVAPTISGVRDANRPVTHVHCSRCVVSPDDDRFEHVEA